MPTDKFSAAFKSYRRNAKKAVKENQPHDQRRAIFYEFMNDGFGIKVSDYKTEPFVSQSRIDSGYIDHLYNNLLIEFKKDFEREHAAGIEEINRYFRIESTAQYAFYTDVCRFRVYKRDGNSVKQIDEKDIRKLSEVEALHFFDSFFFSADAIVPTSEDIVARFGANSVTYNSSYELLAAMWGRLSSDPTAQTKYAQWNQLLSKVHGKLPNDHDLFLRHTYLSLLVKCLALVALPIDADLSGDKLLEVIDGRIFRAHRYPNLVEEDFFAWVLSGATRDDAKDLLAMLLARIRKYDLTRINEDLLKELYQNLVDSEERQESGEFYTPDWLADLVIIESGYPDALARSVSNNEAHPSLVDPACGSGTFIFRAIATARRCGLTGESLVRYCCQGLMGMDVHPLAVTIARINFVLGLAAELKGYTEDVFTPVYIADALQEFHNVGGGTSIHIDSTGPGGESEKADPFSIPAALATNRELFDQIIELMQSFSLHDGKIPSITDGFWKAALRLGADPSWQAELVANCRLLTTHVRKKTDSIWGYVLRNCSQPAFLRATKADFIVGNPPWKALRNISHKAYQEAIKKQIIRHGLLSKNDKTLFGSMEVCTLFFAVCETDYLKPGGVVSFILNRSVLSGASQHEVFRSSGFSSLIDGKSVFTKQKKQGIFPMPFCVATRRTSTAVKTEIPFTELSGRVPRGNPSLEVVSPDLVLAKSTYSPPRPLGPPTFYSSRFQQGATITPMAFWYVRLRGVMPQKVTAPVPLESDPEISAGGKEPWKGRHFTGECERDFLYATLRGENYVPFAVLAYDLVIAPLVLAESKNTVLTLPRAVKEGYASIAEWMKQVQKVWAEHKKPASPKDVVERINKYRLLEKQTPCHGYKVIINKSGTNIASVVIDASEVVGVPVGGVEVKGFVADTQTYLYCTESRQEAHYLCAVLNSATVNEAVKPYQSAGEQGERDLHTKALRVSPVPRFASDNPDHEKLALLSIACHDAVAVRANELLQMSANQRRTFCRKAVADFLDEIDTLTKRILASDGSAASSGESPRGLFAE